MMITIKKFELLLWKKFIFKDEYDKWRRVWALQGFEWMFLEYDTE